MTSEVPTPSVADYVQLTDGWLNWPSVQGVLSLTGDYADGVVSENAGGIDIQLHEYIVSPDWDILPIGGGSSSGGGGTDTHNALDGLQGGDSGAGEYFHLSQLELDKVNSRSVDGGHASDTYLPEQSIDGGTASG